MDGGGSSSTSNQCLKTEFKWLEPSGSGTMDGKPYRFYQHVAGDCLYTLFVYDDPSVPSWFEMSNMKGQDYFSLIVKGKNHAERIISTIEDTE